MLRQGGLIWLRFYGEGRVIEESNYCFGEGGAGTFSDGKLYTRATKRGPVAEVYQTLVAHGAPEKILVEAHPHIGSNLVTEGGDGDARVGQGSGGERCTSGRR